MDNIAIAITNDGALGVYAAITTDMVRQAQNFTTAIPSPRRPWQNLNRCRHDGAMLKTQTAA